MKFKEGQTVRFKEGINLQDYYVVGYINNETWENILNNKLMIKSGMENHDQYGNIYMINYKGNDIWFKESAFRPLRKTKAKPLNELEWLDKVQSNFRE